MSRPHEDDAVLLCLRIGRGQVTAGSLRKLCDVCHQPIAVSRASLDTVIAAATEASVKWWLICLECSPDVVPKDTELMPMSEGQRAELEAELRRRQEET